MKGRDFRPLTRDVWSNREVPNSIISSSGNPDGVSGDSPTTHELNLESINRMDSRKVGGKIDLILESNAS